MRCGSKNGMLLVSLNGLRVEVPHERRSEEGLQPMLQGQVNLV